MAFTPVIMCGGSGTRLWPLSRPERPKQFVPLIGELSTFQSTILRLAGLKGANPPLVVAGLRHADWIRAELDAIGAAAEVLLEPHPRDLAPAVAAAAAWIYRRAPKDVAVIVAADHHIPDQDAFLSAVERAEAAAANGWIVTLGIQPTEPSTAYGYIKAGDLLDGDQAVRRAAAFIEKPNLERAHDYLKSGFLWNSGNFIASAETLLAELGQYAPEVAEAAAQGVATSEEIAGGWRLGRAFAAAPKISFDYAVMERTNRAAILPVAFEWSDLGAWQAVWQASPQDEHGNSGGPNSLFLSAENCLVRAPQGTQVAVIGASNLAVIADRTGLLICDLSQSQRVKTAADHFAAPPPAKAAVADKDLSAWTRQYDVWLRTSALPLWWVIGADHRRGGYHDVIGLDGRPLDDPKRARVQARQLFVYALSAKLDLDGPWLQAAEHALVYLTERYRRVDGLYRTLVSPEGAVVDDTAYLYDQAFILMATATLYGVTPERSDLLEAAKAHLAAIHALMTHPDGGFHEAGPHPFQANAHMHLLEAALAWSTVDDDPRWSELASQIVDLALSRFIDPEIGCLREFFTSDWRPAAGDDGRLIEPGHQFEWAWLLQRWALAKGSARAHEAAVRLFECGRRGVDPVRSVAIDELYDDFSVKSPVARLWPQTEYVKAALILAEGASGDAAEIYRRFALEGAFGLWRYLETPVPGLWRDRLRPDGAFEIEPAKASSFYHILGAIMALNTHAEMGAA